MATYKLASTDPMTGLTREVLGWHFTMATALDVIEGCIRLQPYGWTWDIHPDINDESQQRLSILSKEIQPGPQPKPQQLIVNVPQWFTVDSQGNVGTLEADDVATNYTVTEWTPPA